MCYKMVQKSYPTWKATSIYGGIFAQSSMDFIAINMYMGLWRAHFLLITYVHTQKSNIFLVASSFLTWPSYKTALESRNFNWLNTYRVGTAKYSYSLQEKVIDLRFFANVSFCQKHIPS